MTTKQLEEEGKQQIMKALNNIGIKDKFLTEVSDIKNKCSECPDNNFYRDIYGNGRCILDPKKANAYGCMDDLLGNNAEPIPNYPVDDPTDNYDDWKENQMAAEEDWVEKDPMDLAKDKFINEYMRGEH